MRMTGIRGLLAILAEAGVPYIFGNPGTTELPLNDALLDEPRLEYIMTLQEIPAVAIADGFAQASRIPGVVNLHISCGLGNAMGMLYNAFRGNVPLVLTAGQQDQRMMFEEPILWGEMVEVTRPWTKWSAEVRRAEDVPSAVRRAIKTALTPPTGPVFLSLPLDVQTAEAELDTHPPHIPDTRVRPPLEAVERAARVLAEAKSPAVLVGSRVQEAGAVDSLVALVEKLGTPVLVENATTHGRSAFPCDHDLFGGYLPFWSPQIREQLEPYDVLLVVGMKLFQQYIYHEPGPMPEHVRIVQLDDDPWELEKNHRIEVGVLGHPAESMDALFAALDRYSTDETEERASARRREWASHNAKRREKLRRDAEARMDARPMEPPAVMETLARILPSDVAVVEESPTTTGAYLERSGALPNTSGYFAHRGWALGWGLNCAIGVKLAWPERPVLAVLGDGSALYGIQGLWTAARYRIPTVFVVTNNRQYKILKDCSRVLQLPHACRDEYVALDLDTPEIDFVGLARAFGVRAERAESPDTLADMVRSGWTSEEPLLIEVPVRPANWD